MLFKLNTSTLSFSSVAKRFCLGNLTNNFHCSLYGVHILYNFPFSMAKSYFTYFTYTVAVLLLWHSHMNSEENQGSDDSHVGECRQLGGCICDCVTYSWELLSRPTHLRTVNCWSKRNNSPTFHESCPLNSKCPIKYSTAGVSRYLVVFCLS